MLSNSTDRVQGELVAVISPHIGSVICGAVFGSIGGRAPGGAVGHQNKAALGILRTVLPILRQVSDLKTRGRQTVPFPLIVFILIWIQKSWFQHFLVRHRKQLKHQDLQSFFPT